MDPWSLLGGVFRKDWTLITRARNGTVSVIRNLSLAEAVRTRNRLDPGWQFAQRAAGRSNYSEMRQSDPGEIAEFHITGPGGWDGCEAAMQHDIAWEPPELLKAGPNAGRHAQFGRCVHCGTRPLRWDTDVVTT